MRKIIRNPFFFVLLVFLLAFFPVWTFLFCLKNDVLTGYLPVRFFMSESIRQGLIPWWNPYVNFGLPQHADMSGGFWNPLTWLISITVGYNIYSITFETLLYIIIGGAGMYRMGSLWNWNAQTKIIAAVCYMCCGYFIGDLQHLNWIAPAGFLPWCFFYYSSFLQKFSFRLLVVNTILFYLYISASHPGMLIGAAYFFSAVTLFVFTGIGKPKPVGNFFKQTGWVILLLLLIAVATAGMIISYTELLPFLTRESKPVINNSALNSTTFQSGISFLFPFTVVKAEDFFQSDIALRNCYIGLIPLVFMLTTLLSNWRKKEVSFFMVVGLFFLLLSSDGFIQTFAYRYFPFIGYVRLPGEFRIFTLFCFLITGCNQLNSFSTDTNANRVALLVSRLLIFFSITASLWGILSIIRTGKTAFFDLHIISQSVDSLKKIAASLTVYDTILIQGIIQAVLLLLILRSIQKLNSKTLVIVVCFDMIAASSLNLPFTGYGTKSPVEVQSLLNQSPHGIPIPELHPIQQNEEGPAGADSIIGAWSFYNKQPGVTKPAVYPVAFKSMQTILEPQVLKQLSANPFLFFQSTKTNSMIHPNDSQIIKLLSFSPNLITVSLNTREPGLLVLLYRDYLYWNCHINHRQAEKKLFLNNFISLNISEPGQYLVEYRYKPVRIINAAFISLATITSLLITLLIQFVRKKSFSN